MSTLSNAVDVLIICLLFSTQPPPQMKEASPQSVRAPVCEALLEARANQLLHTAPGEGGVLVESAEVPGGGVYVEGHTPTSRDLPRKHRLF